jgi:hypothetical protein
MSWSLNTNFSGIHAMGSGAVRPEEGAYVVTIAKTEARDSKNQPGLVNIKVFATIEESGFEVSDIFPLPNGSDAKKDRIFLAKWKGLLQSIGYDASQLDTTVQLSEEWLLNREAYVYFVPRREGEKNSFDETQFITADKYEAVKAGKWKPRVSVQSDAPAMHAPVVPSAPVAAPAPMAAAPAMRAAAPVPTPPAPPKAGGALGRILG